MKRLIAFLLLLALGFLALRWAIGDDEVVTASGGRGAGKQAEGRSRSGVGAQGNLGASVEQRGHFKHAKTRAIPLPGGGARHERIFLLEAKDSQPLRDGLQQLDGVEITLFDKDVPAARITARQAFVELGRDSKGNPSLREDKAIDLRDVVLWTLPGARLEGLRLELGNARVLVGESEVQINTATDNDPVLLVIDGKEHGTLRGKGLQARLPRDRRGALQRIDVDILHEPVLETEGLVVRGRERLHYTEDTSTGTAELAVADVEIDFTGNGLRLPGTRADKPLASGGATKLRGDQLRGWLLRGKQRGDDGELHERMRWRLMQLTGAPVTVDGPGLHLTTPRLTVVPGASGDPFLVTAAGGLSTVAIDAKPTAAQPNPAPVVGTSQRRFHLVRPSEQAGAMHRMFGFPQWTLRPISDLHVVAFEGRSNLDDGIHSVEASNGLQVIRTDPTQEAVIVRGFGETRIDQRGGKPGEQELHATGNDGFLLMSTPTIERLDLGPVMPADVDGGDGLWRSHRFDLRQGTMTATGTGACRLERENGRTKVTLRAPGSDIEARLPGDGGRLSGVRSLVAEFDDREVYALRVVGLPATATFTRNGETLVATAPLIERIGPASLVMLPNQLGPDASLWRELDPAQAMPHLQRRRAARALHGAELVDARAPRIELHHLGADHVLVDVLAAGELPARIDASLEHVDGRDPTTIALEAKRLRLFPFAISPDAVRAHLGGALGFVAELPFLTMQQPWLYGESVHRVVVREANKGLVEGSGHELLLAVGAEAGLFVGDPETMTPATVTQTSEDRVVTATGARVRVSRWFSEKPADGGADLRLQAMRTFPGRSMFLLPTVELHEPGSDLLAHVRATCRGDIDVLPHRVEFLGPVVANSIDGNGGEIADGMHIDAEQLLMERDRETGKIVRVIGNGVRADWQGIRVRSAEMEIDARWHRLTIRDPAGAVVEFADGQTLTAERATINYETMAFTWYRGHLRHSANSKADSR